ARGAPVEEPDPRAFRIPGRANAGAAPPPPSERERHSYAGNSGSALGAWRHFRGGPTMFEDDGCAAFGRLGRGLAIALGPLGEADGDDVGALAERWAVRYRASTLAREEGGCRIK